jgi:hypothetical protein
MGTPRRRSLVGEVPGCLTATVTPVACSHGGQARPAMTYLALRPRLETARGTTHFDGRGHTRAGARTAGSAGLVPGAARRSSPCWSGQNEPPCPPPSWKTPPAGRPLWRQHGAAAALVAAAHRPGPVAAVVSRGGRPDLAGQYLLSVRQPTLLIVGEHDPQVIELNRQAMRRLPREACLEIIPGASHLFEEPGTLDTSPGWPQSGSASTCGLPPGPTATKGATRMIDTGFSSLRAAGRASSASPAAGRAAAAGTPRPGR